jgi:hypothetical protein
LASVSTCPAETSVDFHLVRSRERAVGVPHRTNFAPSPLG